MTGSIPRTDWPSSPRRAIEDTQVHLELAQAKFEMETKLIIQDQATLKKYLKNNDHLKATAAGIRQGLAKLKKSKVLLSRMEKMREELAQGPVDRHESTRAWNEMREILTATHTILGEFVRVVKSRQEDQKYIVFVGLLEDTVEAEGDLDELPNMAIKGFPSELHQVALDIIAEEMHRIDSGWEEIVTQDLADIFESKGLSYAADTARKIWKSVEFQRTGAIARG